MNNNAILKLMFTKEMIQKQVSNLAEDLNKKYAGKTVYLVGVLNGAFIFLADLVRQLTFDVVVDFIGCKSYEGQVSTQNLIFTKQLNYDLTGQNVILVDDMIDSGFTIIKLLEFFKNLKPATLELLIVLDKVDYHPDLETSYRSLFTIPNEYTVGYGLDCDRHYRHLPDIYAYITKNENSKF